MGYPDSPDLDIPRKSAVHRLHSYSQKTNNTPTSVPSRRMMARRFMDAAARLHASHNEGREPSYHITQFTLNKIVGSETPRHFDEDPLNLDTLGNTSNTRPSASFDSPPPLNENKTELFKPVPRMLRNSTANIRNDEDTRGSTRPRAIEELASAATKLSEGAPCGVGTEPKPHIANDRSAPSVHLPVSALSAHLLSPNSKEWRPGIDAQTPDEQNRAQQQP